MTTLGVLFTINIFLGVLIGILAYDLGNLKSELQRIHCLLTDLATMIGDWMDEND